MKIIGLFWETLTPNGDNIPGGQLEDQIDVYFDNFENFKKIFLEKAVSIQGSGWCWLVFNETYHKIEIITTPNQDSPWTIQKTPFTWNRYVGTCLLFEISKQTP